MIKKPHNEGLDDKSTLLGFLLGLFVGGVATVLGARQSNKAPKERAITTGDQSGREKLKIAAPIDPTADSITAGKAAARRRLEELGMNK
jgi:hypothetical protein